MTVCMLLLVALGATVEAAAGNETAVSPASVTAPAAETAATGKPAETLAPQPVLPLIEKRHELSGEKLVAALRQGGYVLYMRHALQIAPVDKPCEGKDLTPKGEDEARTVGNAIRALKIPIGRVLTSEPCRNIDTARALGLGPHEITIDLNPGGSPPGFDVGSARTRRLAEVPQAGTNTILVSHVHGSKKKSEWMHLETAEIIAFLPDGKGASTPVARVRVEGWAALLDTAAATTPSRLP